MKRLLAKVTKSYKGGEKGFTLIELLIVIVILGVLAAAIIPNLSKFVSSGTVGAANAELASIRTAVSAYIADNNGTIPAGVVDPTTVWPQSYITGGIKGAYSVDAAGLVTGTTYPSGVLPAAGGLTWSTDKWIK